jgi:hypothetical protein
MGFIQSCTWEDLSGQHTSLGALAQAKSWQLQACRQLWTSAIDFNACVPSGNGYHTATRKQL